MKVIETKIPGVLIIETDIFGEYFGKGRLPIMFKEHIEHTGAQERLCFTTAGGEPN